MSSEVFIVIDESTSRVITGNYEWDSSGGGVLIPPYGTSFPSSPTAKELFWRTDEKKLYRRNDGNTAWEAVVGEGGGETLYPELHLITSGEVTAGYFTLAQTPADVSKVYVDVVRGIRQVNKQAVGATGATPDFDVLNDDELHFNNNGGATGLSEHIEEDDILIVTYSLEA